MTLKVYPTPAQMCSDSFYQENKEILEMLRNIFDIEQIQDPNFPELLFSFISTHKEHEEFIIECICTLFLIRPKHKEFIYHSLFLPISKNNSDLTSDIALDNCKRNTFVYKLCLILDFIYDNDYKSKETQEEGLHSLFHPYPENSLSSYLYDDSIGNLQDLSALGLFTFNQKVRFDDHTQNFFNINEETILNFSIFYGSIHCFKFLLLNGAEPDDNSLMYAVGSGNTEIFKVLQTKYPNLSYQNCILQSIKFNQYDFFEYLISNHFDQLQNIDYELILSYDNIFAFLFYSLNFSNNKEGIKRATRTKNLIAVKFYFEKNSFQQSEIQKILFSSCLFPSLPIIRYLIEEQHADPNLTNESLNTPLHYACENMNFEVAKYLIEKCNVNLNIQNKYQMTPLYIATENSDMRMVRYLIKTNKIDPEIPGECGRTPLHIACEKKNLEIVQYLIEKGKVNKEPRDKENRTPLHIACLYGGSFEIVKYLITQDVDVEAQDCNGQTPLHIASESDKNITQYLIEVAHANVNERDKEGATPFLYICQWMYTDLFPLFINNGFDSQVRDNNGRNAIHYSVKNKKVTNECLDFLINHCHLSINDVDKNGQNPILFACSKDRKKSIYTHNFKILLEYGADITIKDNFNKTALHYAFKHHKLEVFKILLEIHNFDLQTPDNEGNTFLHTMNKMINAYPISFLKLIIEGSYLDINSKDNDGNTILHLETHNGNYEHIKYLLKQENIDKNAVNNKGQTALHIESEFIDDNPSIFTLLKGGLDVNIQDQNGNTAAHLLCEHGNNKIVNFLKRTNANIEIQNKEGYTVLHIACKKGFKSITKYLIKNQNANIYAEDKEGNIPLYLAIHNNQTEIMEYFYKHFTNEEDKEKLSKKVLI